MKRTSIWCLLGLFALAGSTWPQAKPAADGTVKAITAMEEKWLQAMKTNNPDLLAPLLAEGVVSTSSEGKVTGKTEILADVKTNHWESASYPHGLKVKTYGDTAIVSGVFVGKGTDGTGKHLDLQEQWTDTWVKMPGGQWQCVASHGSAIKK